jgi:hypothetical protein
MSLVALLPALVEVAVRSEEGTVREPVGRMMLELEMGAPVL